MSRSKPWKVLLGIGFPIAMSLLGLYLCISVSRLVWDIGREAVMHLLILILTMGVVFSYSVKQSRWRFVFRIVTLVLTLYIGWPLIQYLRGTATIWSAGDRHHRIENYNLHPTFRCPVVKTGDILTLPSLNEVHNLPVLFWLGCLGPMDAIHGGSYPSLEWVKAHASTAGNPLDLDTFLEGTADLGLANAQTFDPNESVHCRARANRYIPLTGFKRDPLNRQMRVFGDGADTIIVTTPFSAVLINRMTGKSYAAYNLVSEEEKRALRRGSSM